MIAKVIVDVATSKVNRPFDYLIPENLLNSIKVGQRVFVPFGQKHIIGYVISIENKTEYENKLKEIIKLVDPMPLLNEELVELGIYLSNKNFSPVISNYQMMIPSGLKVTYQKEIHLLKPDLIDEKYLKLFKNFKMPYESFKDLDLLNQLLDKNIVEIVPSFKQKGNIKQVKMVHLLDSSKASSKKGMELLKILESENDLEYSYILHELNFSSSVIETLSKNKAIEVYLKEEYRKVLITNQAKKVTLNKEQENAYHKIKDSLNCFKTFLLFGVTGSGKTEVYLNLIEEVIKQNKQALLLIPEITLTSQIAQRVKGRFNDLVAIIHSKLSQGEKYDEWRRIKRNEAKVILGARSSLFMPIDNLGIIIMDEEQESSYNQTENPKYHSIDVASFRAKYHNCPLVLGSATPSILSYYKALNKEYELIEILKRANNKPLSNTILVDMANELKENNRSVFSKRLKKELVDCYNRNEQAILFINRRGYSSFVMCRSCGHVIKCPHCDVSLSYHKDQDLLMCHYCGFTLKNPKVCPKCESKAIRFVGDGIEKVLEELSVSLPKAKVLRMDSDSIKGKNGYNEIINSFQNHEYDILIGSQMVAKGLDFKDVSLVGVMNADLGLFVPSYDAFEKTYDLLEQVSGRAGRALTSSIVVIQSYNIDHFVIQAAKSHSYLNFYHQELENRRISNNPPFTNMLLIKISSKNAAVAFIEAKAFLEKLKSIYKDARIIGPAKDFLFKISDLYRFNITLKTKGDLNDLCDIILQFQEKKNVYISVERI